ncbi:UbiA prenyltransferase family, partial [Suillus clintonianus]|uniref:UbiA prenyltransferase family n=1 Tax=Suillus clintonianus TaxID=1904413 RepID=UPI001B872B8C
ILMLSLAASTLHRALHHFKTAWLFTRSDFKTFIFPVMVTAIIASPRHTPLAVCRTLCWLWFHLLQFNVSNQSYSAQEDVVNKPWRPLPSGRISVEDARSLRWGLLFLCLGLSSLFSFNALISSAASIVVMILYDDLRLSHHPIFRNLRNVAAFVTGGVGCSLTLSGGSSLDGTSVKAISCTALVILLTVHAHDLANTDGDRKSGRRTLPIIAPEGSRIYMLCALPLLSFGLASLWSLSVAFSLFLSVL